MLGLGERKDTDRSARHLEPETLRFAASGLERPWWLKSQWRSPRYTTGWEELPVIKAGALTPKQDIAPSMVSA